MESQYSDLEEVGVVMPTMKIKYLGFLFLEHQRGLMSLVCCSFGQINDVVKSVCSFSSNRVCGQDKFPLQAAPKKKVVRMRGGYSMLLWCL